MPAAPPLLLLQDITLRLGSTPLLAGAELSVGPGERLALVGRNGSGKSTLLRIAAGLTEPEAGSRFLQPGTTLRYLPQEPDLSGHATVLDYVLAGLGPADGPHRARHLLERLGLTGEETPARLSGGEARRAALAQVLAPSPDILLLDEPTNHLDLPTITWLEQELAAMRGTALVLVSHDRRFLETLSRAMVWLDRGTRGGWSGASPPSRPGATRCWSRRSASATGWTGRSRARSTGCATASRRGAGATCAASASWRRCASAGARRCARWAGRAWRRRRARDRARW